MTENYILKGEGVSGCEFVGAGGASRQKTGREASKYKNRVGERRKRILNST